MAATISYTSKYVACSKVSRSTSRLQALSCSRLPQVAQPRDLPSVQGASKLLGMHPARKANDRFRASAAAQVSDTDMISREEDPAVLKIWRSAEAVAFDVDSTLCEDESIDEVAAFLGCGQEVADMTNKAMGGNVSFRDALQMRLDIMQVSQQNMADFLSSHPPRISPGIKELVATLHGQGKAVYLVSGGFRQIIEPIADILDIPRSNIFANQILYKEDGSYAGFDTEEFTSRSGGKPAALRHIKETFGHKSIVMVGDGATDLEARSEGVADIFIGYGGVVVREKIAKEADWYITSFDGLIESLKA